MDWKAICVLSLWTQALHREVGDSGVIDIKKTALVARILCFYATSLPHYSDFRPRAMFLLVTFEPRLLVIINYYGRGFRGVRNFALKRPSGSTVLSAVRNREASVSRRLTMYYSDSDFNPCHGLCPLYGGFPPL